MSTRRFSPSKLMQDSDAAIEKLDSDEILTQQEVQNEIDTLHNLRRLSIECDSKCDPEMPINSQCPLEEEAIDDSNDIGRNIWVPANVHPEISPDNFEDYIRKHIDINGNLVGLANVNRRKNSLCRRRSTLKREVHISPDEPEPKMIDIEKSDTSTSDRLLRKQSCPVIPVHNTRISKRDPDYSVQTSGLQRARKPTLNKKGSEKIPRKGTLSGIEAAKAAVESYKQSKGNTVKPQKDVIQFSAEVQDSSVPITNVHEYIEASKLQANDQTPQVSSYQRPKLHRESSNTPNFTHVKQSDKLDDSALRRYDLTPTQLERISTPIELNSELLPLKIQKENDAANLPNKKSPWKLFSGLSEKSKENSNKNQKKLKAQSRKTEPFQMNNEASKLKDYAILPSLFFPKKRSSDYDGNKLEDVYTQESSQRLQSTSYNEPTKQRLGYKYFHPNHGRNNHQPLYPSKASTPIYWQRFPPSIERAIYRLSHLKLSNPRRPLAQQVLLSNFMYSYLDMINQSQMSQGANSSYWSASSNGAQMQHYQDDNNQQQRANKEQRDCSKAQQPHQQQYQLPQTQKNEYPASVDSNFTAENVRNELDQNYERYFSSKSTQITPVTY